MPSKKQQDTIIREIEAVGFNFETLKRSTLNSLNQTINSLAESLVPTQGIYITPMYPPELIRKKGTLTDLHKRLTSLNPNQQNDKYAIAQIALHYFYAESGPTLIFALANKEASKVVIEGSLTFNKEICLTCLEEFIALCPYEQTPIEPRRPLVLDQINPTHRPPNRDAFFRTESPDAPLTRQNTKTPPPQKNSGYSTP